MRFPAALSAALLAAGVVGCGGEEDRAPGTGSQPTTRPAANALGAPGTGADALRDFDDEPDTRERAAIVRAVLRYNAATIAADPARICAATSRAMTRQMRSFGERSKRKICGAFPGYTADMRRKLSRAKVTQVRLVGRDRALVVYTVAGPRWNMLPMQREGGVWKLGAYGEWSRTE